MALTTGSSAAAMLGITSVSTEVNPSEAPPTQPSTMSPDAMVGERVNYGAGSITANYDGANKPRTVIEADAHIGSNCVLVAPVTIGAGATVGGGSTITKEVPAGALSVARGKQVNIANWARPVKLPKG